MITRHAITERRDIWPQRTLRDLFRAVHGRCIGIRRDPVPLFTPYTRLPERVPFRLWTVLRCVSVTCLVGIAIAGVVRPAVALTLFWSLVVPLLPGMFLFAPGFWRNVCPLAALNQIPTARGFSRGWTLPKYAQRVAAPLSAGLFLIVVPLRKVLLDQHGLALSIFLIVLMSLAFMGGLLFKGKSGWCSQFCPLLMVERFYGQSAIVVVRNRYCKPCVGCARNCYDANPTAAYLGDLHSADPRSIPHNILFAGAMPWFIAAFFVLSVPHTDSIPHFLALYGQTFLFLAVGMGMALILDAWVPITTYQLILAHAVLAINVFYWFVSPLALQSIGASNTMLPYLVRTIVLAVSLLWLRRAWPRERAYLAGRASRASAGQRGAHTRPTAVSA